MPGNFENSSAECLADDRNEEESPCSNTTGSGRVDLTCGAECAEVAGDHLGGRKAEAAGRGDRRRGGVNAAATSGDGGESAAEVARHDVGLSEQCHGPDAE